MTLSYYRNIDECLGSSQSRYFGGGFLNTSYALSEFTESGQDDDMRFFCVADVRLPPMWSKKGNRDQKPHLSSIDVIELSIRCLKTLLERVSSVERRLPRSISSMTVLAGKDPVEEGLHALTIQGGLTQQLNGSTAISLNIANMKASLILSAPRTDDPFIDHSEKHPILIDDLMLNVDDLKASGVVLPSRLDSSSYWSLSSCFAAALQMGQVLLYRHDNVAREKSNTLWMRKIAIGISSAIPSLSSPQPIYTKLDKVKNLTMDGADWRSADVVTFLSNLCIVCSVAHKLA